MSTLPELPAILQSHRIDTTSLQCLTGADQELVYYLSIPGEKAISRWQRLRSLVPKTGYWTVLLGTEDHLEWHGMELDRYPQLPSPTALMEASRAVDAENWFVEAARNVDLERQIPKELVTADTPDDEFVEDDVFDARVDELLSKRTVTLDDLLDIWLSYIRLRRTYDIIARQIFTTVQKI